MDNASRYIQARFVTVLGAVKNIILAALKIVFGIAGHSHALFADGVHSLSDLFIDVMVLVASRFGSKDADSDHPYGHGRIETAVTLLLAFVLAAAGVGIIVDAGFEIYNARTPVQPAFYVIYIAAFSVLLNEILYFYTRRTGECIQSALLITNAWHHRSDSASSLVVLIGVGCAWLGLKTFDAIGAVIVGLMVIKMAWQFGWNSIRELVDTGLDDGALEKIQKIITSVPGVRHVHQLRTRSVGGRIFLDVHIQVDSKISVSEGHYIGQQVHFSVEDAMPVVADVTVHVDPEDDEISAPSRYLPSRQELLLLLKQHWAELIAPERIERATLHYLAGKISIELVLPQAMFDASLVEQLQLAIKNVPAVASVQIFYR